jgi:hypothetical protein
MQGSPEECLLQQRPPNDPIAPRCHGTLIVLYLSASVLRPSVVRCQCCCCCCCCLWSCRGRGPRREGSGPTGRRGAGNHEPRHLYSLFCPTAAYYLLEFVLRSSEESVSVGAVPDGALTGRASLTSAVTSALTRCGSLWPVTEEP